MSWNYRVVKTIVDGEPAYGIHEHHVVNNGRNDRHGWTARPVPAQEESLDDLRTTLERMLSALDHDVIDGTEE